MNALRFSSAGAALCTALLVALPACQLSPSAGSASDSVRYGAEEFFATNLMFGASFSPNETGLLVTSNESGVYNAHRISLDGSKNEQVTQSTTDAIYTIGFFPGDERFLYQSDQGGNELTHIYVREPSGRVVDLTPGERLKARFLGWAQDDSGFWIATNERDPKYFDVYWHRAGNSGEEYPRERVFENNDGYSVATVESQGRWVALTKNRTNDDNDIYLYDLRAKSEPRLATPHEGPISHSVSSFDPRTGDLIYTSDFGSEYSRAWRLNTATGARELLYEAPWDVSSVRFSRDGRFRVISVNADARTTIAVVDRGDGSATGRERSVQIPIDNPASVAGLRFAPSGRKAAYYLRSDTSTGNLQLFDLQTKHHKQLARGLSSDLNEIDLVEGERVRFPSYDELMIPGILYRPHQASADNPVPAVVWVHGGPGGQSRHGYFETLQFLVHHGYAFLSVNNRGSSGYGKSFFHLDDRQHGEGDLKDCIYGRKYLEGLDWVDGSRVAIMGGSYGGYMVAAALALEPEAFDAGIDIFGVTNWVRTLESIPPWWSSFRDSLYAEMGDPAQDGERLRRISPLFHADKIRRPLLVVQGANDPRVLQVESDEIVAAVRKNDIPVEYIVFPDEGHGFRNQENRIKAAKTYLAFLNKHLRGRPAP